MGQVTIGMNQIQQVFVSGSYGGQLRIESIIADVPMQDEYNALNERYTQALKRLAHAEEKLSNSAYENRRLWDAIHEKDEIIQKLKKRKFRIRRGGE